MEVEEETEMYFVYIVRAEEDGHAIMRKTAEP
jgi:hypothetical protein